MTSRFQRPLLVAICAIYVLLATIYSIVTPPFEASDELWHYPMVEYIATNGFSLPVQDASISTPWRQEGSQPPLYYFGAALVTAWIDTSDLERVRRVNPHADIGLVRPDGNVNMIAHREPLEAFPWTGAILALHVSRFFSILLGLGTVLVTYALARNLFPERPELALGAAALNAGLPMFLFISGSVNNDNLSNLLGNLLTLLIVQLVQQDTLPHWRTYAILGVVTGAGLLAKLNIGFLIPIIALSLLLVSIRQRNLRPLIIGGVISGGLTIAIAGWWYLRNAQLYGDPTGLNVFLDIVGRRAIPANAAQLWAERHSFTQAFWGFFGGVNVPMPEPIHLVFNILGGVGLVSAIAFLLWKAAIHRDWSINRWLAVTVTWAWMLITFISYLRWTSETPASQGRLVFGALSSILLWIAVGWTWFFPRRIRVAPLLGLAVWFIGIGAIMPFTVIAPAYARPDRIPSFVPTHIFSDGEGRGVGLSSEIDLPEASIHPGDYVTFTTRWQIERALSRDWSLFAHLVTPDGVILAQRDIYPGGGTLATSDLVTGFAWENPISIAVPDTAYAPMTLEIVVGWYHLPTGERLVTADGAETVSLGTVELTPRAESSDVPNPISVNFGNQMELIGYEVTDISPAAGQSFDVTLYWRALQPMNLDYTVFIHLIDPPTSTIYAGSDAQPAGWTRPTTTWQTGEIIEDRHTLTVNAQTPPAIYELEIGVYRVVENTYPRLRIVTADGGMANDFIYLTRMRVLPAEAAETSAP